MMPNNRKFKNYLLIPKFQLTLMGYFVGLFVLTTVSLYSTSYLFFWNLNQKALKVGIPEGHVFFKFMENQKKDLDALFILLVVVNFILLIGTGIVASHRIAGPIYKLKKYLAEITPNSPVFKFRNKDFFKDLEPIVDALRERLK